MIHITPLGEHNTQKQREASRFHCESDLSHQDQEARSGVVHLRRLDELFPEPAQKFTLARLNQDFLIILNQDSSVPQVIFSLSACTITAANKEQTSFIIEDHVHRSIYHVECLLPSMFSVAGTVSDINTFLRERSEGQAPPENSFTFHRTVFQDLKKLPFFNFWLKFICVYPWPGKTMVLVRWLYRLVILLCLPSYVVGYQHIAFNYVIWDLPVYVLVLILVYVHLFVSKFLAGRHFEYMLSMVATKHEFIKVANQYSIVLTSLVAFASVSISAVLIVNSYLLSEQFLASSISSKFFFAFVNIMTVVILVPCSFVSIGSLALTCRAHMTTVQMLLHTARYMTAAHKLDLHMLHSLYMFRWAEIHCTAKAATYQVLAGFVVFVSFNVIELFEILHMFNVKTNPEELAYAIATMFLSLVFLAATATPIVKLNMLCERVTYELQVIFNSGSSKSRFSNNINETLFHKSLSSIATLDMHNDNNDYNSKNKPKSKNDIGNFSRDTHASNGGGESVERLERLEFCFQLEKMELGFFVIGIKLTPRFFSISSTWSEE